MIETTPPSTGKSDVRAIRILFNAIVAGLGFFALIAGMVAMPKKTPSPFGNSEDIVLIASIAIGVVCVIVASISYKKAITVAKDSLISFPGKLNQYRSALIRYLAFCEFPGLLGVILFFITGNYLMFIVTGLMLLAMLMKAPGRQRMIGDLGLDWQQEAELE